MGINTGASVAIFWFRRDLRLHDNSGLYHALKQGQKVQCLFIFDTDILSKLEYKKDARVSFLYSELQKLQQGLIEKGASLLVKHGKPLEIFKTLFDNNTIAGIYTNHDYEPYALQRDEDIKALAESKGATFTTYKDQVIFEKGEITGTGNKPYKVFTPYKNKWLATVNDFYLKSYPTEDYFHQLLVSKPLPFPTLADLGFEKSSIEIPSSEVVEEQIRTYDLTRNFPKDNSTSRIGVHLRFGTVSIRDIARLAKGLNEVWLSELIWREFFMQLLFHFPYVVVGPFNERFKTMNWRHNEHDFKAWCEGKTGYPLVDAGMRELNATGFMHNRARLVTASFLCKHLLIDYRWGEAYFSQKLIDYDLSSNNGNWQWSAGTGADAQPFFRIFNPLLQQEKFDRQFEYIRKWVPEYGTPAYSKPMIEHKQAVERAKKAFGILRASN